MKERAASEGDVGGLPASIERAWGVRERPTKGPRRGLSLERIVEAAVKIAVAEGLAAVSMHRVASELGTSAMSLYRYVAAKDELLALMADAAGGRPPAAEGPDEGCREGLARCAWSYRAVLHRHPWVLRVPISGPPTTPNLVACLEAALHALWDTGLTEGEKLSVALLVSGFVRNEAMLTADITAAAVAAGTTIGEVMPSYGRLLARLTEPDAFPALHRAIATGGLDDEDDADHEFVFGLDRILDGIAALVRSRGG